MSVPLQAAYLCPMKVCQSIIYLFVSNKKPFHLTQMAKTGGELPVQSSKKGRSRREPFPVTSLSRKLYYYEKRTPWRRPFLRGLQGRKRSGWGPRQAGMSLTTRQRRGPVPVPEKFLGRGARGRELLSAKSLSPGVSVIPTRAASRLPGRVRLCPASRPSGSRSR